MQQKVLITAPISLFEVVDGTAIDRGSCACAIVAAASSAGRVRYSIVCYNDRRETLCVASISASLEQSIQFQLSTGTYACFRDGAGKHWRCVFLSAAKLQAFLAALGIAAYALAGRPSHSVHVSDFTPPGVDIQLQQNNRARVHYAAYAVRDAELPLLGELLESNGEELYSFRPLPSTAALLQDEYLNAYGFECGVIGMAEGTTRAIVVPAAALPSSRRNMYAADAVAFVVQLVNIIQDQSVDTESEAVPMVLTAGEELAGADGEGGALIVAAGGGSSGAGAVVTFTGEGSTGAQKRGAVEPGAGVPEGHMEVIQRLGMLLNGAVENARNVRSLTEATAAGWRHAINRPKPSRLTNAALLQAVQQLIMESDRVNDAISQRDGLIRELERRNQEIQRRIDSAVLASQELLDEKNKCTRTASDMKLEGERAIMQVQQQINQAAMERDDAQRHLQTVKQLLQAAETELRDLRGTAALNTEETNGATVVLNNLQDALAEERSRRKALDATIVTLQEQLSNAKTELHVKNSQLEDIRRSADMQRTHHAQVVEDERQRRAQEVQLLRTEFITELQTREAKFIADRARVSEENFRRGQAEGRSVGKAESRGTAAEHRQQELTLEAQRLLAELNVCRADLRQIAEEGMQMVRTSGMRAARLQAQLHEENFKRGKLETSISNTRGRLQSGRDKIMAALTSVAHRLRRPIKACDLLALLDALRKRKPLDFSFQEREYRAEVASVVQQRCKWIEESALMLYSKCLAEEYDEWLTPLQVECEAIRGTVYSLMVDRDGEALCEFNIGELRSRHAIVVEMEHFFDELLSMFNGEVAQRRQLFTEVERAATELLEKHAEYLTIVDARWSSELEERQLLRTECARGYVGLLLKQEAEFRAIVMEAATSVHIADQNDLIATEGGVRNAIDSEECAEFSGLLFDYENEKRIVLRNAALTAERSSILSEETEMRACIASEEETNLQITIEMFAGCIPSLQPVSDAQDPREQDCVAQEQPHDTLEGSGEDVCPPPVTTSDIENPDSHLVHDGERRPQTQLDEQGMETGHGEVHLVDPAKNLHEPQNVDVPLPISSDSIDKSLEIDVPPPLTADDLGESDEDEGPPPVAAEDLSDFAEVVGPPPAVADGERESSGDGRSPPAYDANIDESPEVEGPPQVDDDNFSGSSDVDGPPPVLARDVQEPPQVDDPPSATAEAVKGTDELDGPPSISEDSATDSTDARRPPAVKEDGSAEVSSRGENNNKNLSSGTKPNAPPPPTGKVPQRKLPTFDSSDSDW